MNTTVSPEAKPRVNAVHPDKPIEGFVYIQGGPSLHDKPGQREGGSRGVARYLHGLVVPGMGKGRKRNSTEEIIVPRNRMLIPDRDCYAWFKQLVEAKQLDPKVNGVGIKCNVKTLLGDNVAFIRPSPRTLEQALMEWSAHQLELRGTAMDSMNVHDAKSLCAVFYSRGAAMRDNMILSKINTRSMTALAVMKNGFFYKLTGADRLTKHIGRAGTNGMILDRDIDTVFRFNQIFDMDEVQAMINDPESFSL